MPDHFLATATRIALLAAWLTVCGMTRAATDDGVAWQPAANNGDIDRAFAQARSESKPVLLYWGAKWCPPCNQLKATLFNRHDFIERSKSLVAVEIDGDLPGAQKLGARFKVSGYPTMVLMRTDGAELMRLPGEADAPQVLQLLEFGLAGGRAAKAVLADARAGKPLPGAEWRMLAFYSWDHRRIAIAGRRRAPRRCWPACRPPARAARPSSATRLMLKALADSDDGKGVKADAALRQRVRGWLGDPALARAQMDVLTNYAAEITKARVGVGQRRSQGDRGRLRQRAAAAAGRRHAVARRPPAVRSVARVDLARIDAAKNERHPRIAAPLQQQVRDASARADREITDGYERQAVITAAAYVLGQAGLWNESDALLKANLAKSHSPYYLMSQLGGNARKLGRNDEALRWYEEAFTRSEGPATRLQWGAQYVSALVELAPQDEAAAGARRHANDRRSRARQGRLRRTQRALAGSASTSNWRSGTAMAATAPCIARLRAQLQPVCGRLDGDPAAHAACDGTFKPAAKTSA